jgi:hypothetical protein
MLTFVFFFLTLAANCASFLKHLVFISLYKCLLFITRILIRFYSVNEVWRISFRKVLFLIFGKKIMLQRFKIKSLK